MNFLKSFLKKYSALILPAALVIVAFLFLIPTMVISGGLSEKMQASMRMNSDLSSLIGQAPSQATVEDASRYMQRFEKEVQSIQEMAVRTTQRELIQYGLFPKSEDSSTQVFRDFGSNFRRGIEGLIGRMNAKDAPSEAEIQSRLGYGARPQAGGGGYGMNPFGGGMGNTPGNETQNAVLDAVCLERAEQISVYADPGVFPVYPFWENYRFPGRDQAIRDCWYSQVAFWIYEDVAASIESINIGSKRIDDSPIKRLLGVSFKGPVANQERSRAGFYPGGMNQNMNMTSLDKPIYVSAAVKSPFIAQSWTARTGNETVDVIHFGLSVIADSRQLLSFYRELCSSKPHTFREGYQANGKTIEGLHNQITILESAVTTIDPQSPGHLYYRYGLAGVVRVDLVCEYLLYRAGYDTLKPEPVKAELGLGEAGSGGQMQDPGGMGMGMPFM